MDSISSIGGGLLALVSPAATAAAQTGSSSSDAAQAAVGIERSVLQQQGGVMATLLDGLSGASAAQSATLGRHIDAYA